MVLLAQHKSEVEGVLAVELVEQGLVLITGDTVVQAVFMEAVVVQPVQMVLFMRLAVLVLVLFVSYGARGAFVVLHRSLQLMWGLK
jgi:hypothetical protein